MMSTKMDTIRIFQSNLVFFDQFFLHTKRHITCRIRSHELALSMVVGIALRVSVFDSQMKVEGSSTVKEFPIVLRRNGCLTGRD